MLSNITNFSNIYKSDIKIPEFVQNRTIKDSDISILKNFFEKNNISNFSEITIDIVNQFAKYDYDKAIQVNTILGLYGVEFIGKSSKKYSPNSRNTISLLVSQKNLNLYETKLFQQNYKNLEIRFLEYFEKIGITSSEQITGINLSVLLDKLNIIDLNIENLEKDLNCDYFIVVKNNFEQLYTDKPSVEAKIEKNSLIVEDGISIINTDLTTRTVNSLLANGIDTIGKLRQLNIDEFRKRRNVGRKTVDEILSYLNLKGYENSPFQEVATTRYNIKNEETNLTINQPEEIDEKIYNLKINKLNLPQKIEKVLNSEHVTTIGKFIENANLIGLKPREKNLIYEKIEVYGVDRYKKYIPKLIKIPENYFLKISEVFQDDWIISACKKHNLKNIGLLANVFPDIFAQDEDLVSHDIFFEKINCIENKLRELGINKTPINLSYIDEKELSKKEISELINVNYITQIESILVDFFNSPQVKDKQIEIIKKRFGVSCDKKTLEEVSSYYNCSKENIRAYESRTLRKVANELAQHFQSINEDISILLDYFGSIIVIKNTKNTNMKDLIARLINNIEDRVFDIDFDNLYLVKKDFSIHKIQEEAIETFENLENYFDLNQIKQIIGTIVNKYINNLTPEQSANYILVYDKLFLKILEENFIKYDDNLYKLRMKRTKNSRQDRDEKIIHWVKELYPNGIHIPGKGDDKIRKSLEPIYKRCVEIEKIAPRQIERTIKYHRDIIWWGRGTYIHVDNIKIDWQVVDFAIKEVIKKFDSGLYRIKPNVIYEEHKHKFISANILNETALCGLIRYKNNPRINTRQTEMRDANNANLELNILETFEQFILEYPDGINKKDLINEMCNKRGWQKIQIEFLYSRSNVIYNDNGVYYHENNLCIDENKLSEIINFIQIELNNDSSSFVHLRKIREEHSATWVGVVNKDVSLNFMGKLLSNKLQNEDIVICDYVYVKKSKHFDEGISVLKILDKFVEEKSLENKYVTMVEILDFCRKQGLKDTKQPIEEIVSKFSFEYNDESEAYVHKNVLGYSEESQMDLFSLIEKLTENDFTTPFIDYEDVILEYNNLLPILNEGYEWNYPLLRSALYSIENIDVFYKAFIFKDNKFGVEDLDDAAAYLIMKNCENGCCKFKELDKLMARYGIAPHKKLHYYKSKLFFESSSIRLIKHDTSGVKLENNEVVVEKFARDKYLNV